MTSPSVPRPARRPEEPQASPEKPEPPPEKPEPPPEEPRVLHEFAGQQLRLPRSDRSLLDLLMVLEGSTGRLSVTELCAKYGYRSTRSYYEKRRVFERHGMRGLLPRRRGPKRPTRRTPLVVQRVIAARFECPTRTADEIAARLNADGLRIGSRSVERILSEYGLTKVP